MTFINGNFLIGLGLVVMGILTLVVTGMFEEFGSTSLVASGVTAAIWAASGVSIVTGLAVWLFRQVD